MGIYLIIIYWEKLSVASGIGQIHEAHSGLTSLLSSRGRTKVGGSDRAGWLNRSLDGKHKHQLSGWGGSVGGHQTPRVVPRYGTRKPPLPQVLCTGKKESLNN